MEPSVLHSQIFAFDERNTFLYFALGLVPLSCCLMRELDAARAAPAPPGAPAEEASNAGPVADQFLYFALGLAALSGHLMRDLEAARHEPAQPCPPSDADELTAALVAGLRGLLR